MDSTRDEGPRYTAQAVGEHGELETIPVETLENEPITQQQDLIVGEDSDVEIDLIPDEPDQWNEEDEWFEELFGALQEEVVFDLVGEIMETEYTWYPTMTELNREQHAKNGNPPTIVKDDGMKIYVCSVEPCLIRRHVHRKKVLTGAARRDAEKGDKKGKKKKQPVYVSCEEDPNECAGQHGHYGDCKVCTRLATKYSPSHPLLGGSVPLEDNESEDEEEEIEVIQEKEKEVVKKKKKAKKETKENIEVPAQRTSHHESESSEDESLSLSVIKTCVTDEDKIKKKKKKKCKVTKEVVPEATSDPEKPRLPKKRVKAEVESEPVLLIKGAERKHQGKKERKVRNHVIELESEDESVETEQEDEEEEDDMISDLPASKIKTASARRVKTKSEPLMAPAKSQAPRGTRTRKRGDKTLTSKIDDSLKPQLSLPAGISTFEKQIFLSGRGNVRNGYMYRFASIFFRERNEHAVNMDLNSLQTGSYNDGAVRDTISIFRMFKLVSKTRTIGHELIEAGLTRTLRVHVFREIAEALLVDATLTGMKIVTADGEAILSAPGRIQTQAMSLPNGKTLMRDFPDVWVWTMVYTLNQFMLAQLRLQRALPAKKKLELPRFPSAHP